MERKHFTQAPCSIARSLEVFGDWWIPLILRECVYGISRFDAFQRTLGIGRNILTKRLEALIAEGVLEKRPAQDGSARQGYFLTPKGFDAASVMLGLMPFGERWYFAKGEVPIQLYNRHTHRKVRPLLVDADTGAPLDARDLYAGPGPAFPADISLRRDRFTEYYAHHPEEPRQATAAPQPQAAKPRASRSRERAPSA